MIALVGNPFSTRYARARRAGAARATDFVAMNVSLHGPGGAGAWCLTERGRGALSRSAEAIRIGSSSWLQPGTDELVVRLDERTAPFAGRVTGDVRVTLGRGAAGPVEPVALDARGRHRWWPLAPVARADVQLVSPRVAFRGNAYVDAQLGDEPLEEAFTRWTWSRSRCPSGSIVTFDVARRDGTDLSLSRRFAPGGAAVDEPDPDLVGLPPTGWRLPRSCRTRGPARLLRNLEDGPSYARALLETTFEQQRAVAVHEVLDLDRLQARWVRFLTPFRMRREA